MAPYYQDDWVTLYHGDCLEILPTVSADVALTDPPWEVSEKATGHLPGGVGPHHQVSKTIIRGAIGYFDPDAIATVQERTDNDCFFLCGYKELATVISRCDPIRGVFVWQKPNAAPAVRYPVRPDCSFIVWAGKKSLLYNQGTLWPSMVFSHNKPNAGCMATERFVDKKTNKATHPCQGPLSLYLDLLKHFPKGLTVLDAYAGTGTTLRAAKDLQLKSIGIEINERYCELIAKRMCQQVFNFG